VILLDRSTYVLQRRINRPPDAVSRIIANSAVFGPDCVVASDSDGELRLDSAFRSVPGSPGYLRADAQLVGPRRRIARVELEVSPWSGGATELVLRPSAKHPEWWSARRLRNYFARAHDAADHFARLLFESADEDFSVEPSAPGAQLPVG
jgi:hypothetical protein